MIWVCLKHLYPKGLGYFAVRGKGATFRKLYFPSVSVYMAMCSFRDSEELGGRESQPLLLRKKDFLCTMLSVWLRGAPGILQEGEASSAGCPGLKSWLQFNGKYV